MDWEDAEECHYSTHGMVWRSGTAVWQRLVVGTAVLVVPSHSGGGHSDYGNMPCVSAAAIIRRLSSDV